MVELDRERLIRFGRERAAEGAGPVTIGIDIGTIKLVLLHPAAETTEAANNATMVVAMVECAEALMAVDEIAAVDGVDVVLIGTNDLCGDLG